MGGIIHGASLLQFLIVSNQLSPDRSRTPSSLLILMLAVGIVPVTRNCTNRLQGVVHLMRFSAQALMAQAFAPSRASPAQARSDLGKGIARIPVL
jgi:hypothetical protein